MATTPSRAQRVRVVLFLICAVALGALYVVAPSLRLAGAHPSAHTTAASGAAVVASAPTPTSVALPLRPLPTPAGR